MTRYVMIIDQERCLGCHACTIACKVQHNLGDETYLRVETVGGRMDVPLGKYPDLTLSYRPVSCMHCAEAPCVVACPTEALYRRDDGLVLVAATDCSGCASCLPVCPYDAIRLNDSTGVVEKCTYCVERLDAGMDPFCVVCCEGRAMSFGDIDDPVDQIVSLLSQRQAYSLNDSSGAKPATRYLPPMPKRGLARATCDAF